MYLLPLTSTYFIDSLTPFFAMSALRFANSFLLIFCPCVLTKSQGDTSLLCGDTPPDEPGGPEPVESACASPSIPPAMLATPPVATAAALLMAATLTGPAS